MDFINSASQSIIFTDLEKIDVNLDSYPSKRQPMAVEKTDLEARIVDLESQLAFMQVTIDELNSVVTSQQSTLDDLTKQFKELTSQLKDAMIEKDNVSKPPHY